MTGRAVFAGLFWFSLATTSSVAADLVVVPEKIDPACRGGQAQAYDECGSQSALLSEAIRKANANGKTVLAVYGAEWCIWCHVFKSHLKGEHGIFRYKLDGEAPFEIREPDTEEIAAQASELAQFAAANFVILSIEGQYSPDGWETLEAIGAAPYFNNALPYVFSLDEKGRFKKALHQVANDDDIEVRINALIYWYRGYDRTGLQSALTQIR